MSCHVSKLWNQRPLENTPWWLMQLGSVKPDYTASQPDRHRGPVTFTEPKYWVAKLYFLGFYCNWTALRIAPSFSTPKKRQICVKSELLADKATHPWHGRPNAGNMIHHTLKTEERILLPQCYYRHAHCLAFLGTKKYHTVSTFFVIFCFS